MVISRGDVYISTSVQLKMCVISLSIYIGVLAGTYLVTELSHNLVQSVSLLGEILSLGE